MWQSLSKWHFSPQLVFSIGKLEQDKCVWNDYSLYIMSTVSTVSTVVARCCLHLRWYFFYYQWLIFALLSITSVLLWVCLQVQCPTWIYHLSSNYRTHVWSADCSDHKVHKWSPRSWTAGTTWWIIPCLRCRRAFPLVCCYFYHPNQFFCIPTTCLEKV